MKLTNEELMAVVMGCRDELRRIGIDTPDVKMGRSLRSTRTYGRCVYRRLCGRTYEFSIDLNVKLYDGSCDSDIPLRNTIIHELLHTVVPLDKHGSDWKALATKVNYYYSQYNITRTNDYSKYGLNIEKVVKIESCYILQCNKCGRKFVRQRCSKSIKNYRNFHCGACKGSLSLIQTPVGKEILSARNV